MRSGLTLFCSALVLCCTGACELGSRSPTMEWPGPGDRWRVSFVDPPWEVVRGDDLLVLEIPAEAFGVSFDGAPPTHVFWIGEVDATPESIEAIVGLRRRGTNMPDSIDVDEAVEASELDLPEYLIDVDLSSPAVVALAELDHVLSLEGSRLHRELDTFETASGQVAFTWQAVVQPDVFVRGFYLPTTSSVVRAGFVSRFDLDTPDIDWMASSIRTDTEIRR